MTITIKADEALDAAVETIKSGGIVAYPTETVFGLAVDPFNTTAVKKLFDLKGRSDNNPISLIVNDIEVVEDLVEEIPPLAEKLMKEFWPGPLTIIFKAKATLPKAITAGTGKVGLRVSSSGAAMRLAREAGSAITATSANPTGKPAATTATQVRDYFGDDIDVIIDGGRLTDTTASTVVDITTGSIAIVREGAISTKDLEGNPQ
ncbi:MAG: threonylcarbamoyl-AMP synthase [Deltaproteobacteria bacterium]|nr:threonylcarbamoyl-AMP synthase [Deltaproteobacteria bacterium]